MEQPENSLQTVRHLILLIFLIGYCLNGFGQSYYPFPTVGATWTIVEKGYGTFPPEEGTWHFGINGDTVISGETYTKIYVNPGSLGVVNPEPEFNLTTANYFGAVWEDNTKKVWFRENGQPTDRLYFDFALNLGDTFCFEGQPSGVTCIPVSLVDSILINGNYRRQIHFEHGGQTEAWIEGIGGTVDNLLGYWSFIGNIEWSLNCFNENTINIYGTCDFITGHDEIQVQPSFFHIYPNPTDGQVSIDLRSTIQNVNVNIYNSLGALVINRQIASAQTVTLTLPIESGIYIVQLLFSDGSAKSLKVVKE